MNKKSPKSTIFIFLILPMVCAANLKVFECRSVLAKANDVQPSSYSQLRLKEGELIGAVSFFIYSKEEEVKLHHDKLGQIDLIIKKNITNFNFDDYDNVTIDQEDGAKENSLDEHAVGVSFPKKELIFQGDGFVILLRNEGGWLSFHRLDPLTLAKDTGLFTYLDSCKVKINDREKEALLSLVPIDVENK